MNKLRSNFILINIRKSGHWVIYCVTCILLVAYIYFAYSSLVIASAERNMLEKIDEVSGQIAEAESTYLVSSKAINLQRAQMYGLTETQNLEYITIGINQNVAYKE